MFQLELHRLQYLKNFLAQGTPFEVENEKAIINMELRDRPYLALLYMCEDEQVEAVLAIESCFRWLLVPLALVTPADADIPALRLYLLSLEAAVAKPAADTWNQNQPITFTATNTHRQKSRSQTKTKLKV